MSRVNIFGKILLIGLLTLIPLKQVNIVSASYGVWTSIGPEGGLIYALAVDPVTPTTLYAGAYNGGVFKSTDSGMNWNAINTGLYNFKIRALAINPAMPNILYAGTEDGGVFKSIDGGENWSSANVDLNNDRVYALAIDPTTPATLYAGTEGGFIKV